MIRPELYEAAGQLYHAAPWRWLGEPDLFAVDFPDGQRGYCYATGRGEATPGLHLLPGEVALQALTALRLLPAGAPPHDHFEALYHQDSLSLLFVGEESLEPSDLEDIEAYGLDPLAQGLRPVFRRDRPRLQRWYLEQERDQNRLQIALQATLALCRRLAEGTAPEANQRHPQLAGLGFHPGWMPLLIWRGPRVVELSEAPYPEDVSAARDLIYIDNSELIEQLKALPTRDGMIWAVDRILVPTPMDGRPPSFPTVLLILDGELQVLGMTMARDYNQDSPEILQRLITLMLDRGKPEALIVQDPEAYLLVQGLAGQIRLPLRRQLIEGLSALREDLVDVMVARFVPPEEEENE